MCALRMVRTAWSTVSETASIPAPALPEVLSRDRAVSNTSSEKMHDDVLSVYTTTHNALVGARSVPRKLLGVLKFFKRLVSFRTASRLVKL